MPRRLLIAPVRRAVRRERLSLSRPADFAPGKSRAADEAPADAFPYCLDWLGARSIYVTGPTAQALQDAPFYYLKARQQAETILSVPWEHGRLYPQHGPAPVIFIFSAGRVGSTLLHNVLRKAGIATVSEPDFYGQAMLPGLPDAPDMARRPLSGLLANLTQDLAARLCPPGRPLVVKLRAECCHDPDLLLGALPGARSIFLARNFDDWARSSLKAFRRTPRLLVKRNLQALQCLERLRAAGPCHLLHYEEMIGGEAALFAHLADFIGQDIPAEAMHAALAQDSQADTPVARRSRPEPRNHGRDLARAIALWDPHRARAAGILTGGAESAAGRLRAAGN